MKVDTALQKERNFDEYLSTLIPILAITRWLGIPVYGGKKLILLTLLILPTLISIEVMAIWKLIRAVGGFAGISDSRGVTARLSGAIFYANTIISFLLIWRLLQTWKNLTMYWTSVETKGLYLPPDRNIKKRVLFVTSFVAICACVEHGLSITAATKFDCPPLEWFRRYILSSHGFMLHPDEYSIWIGIPVFISSKIATFIWNFQDLIVILISMGLTSRYHRLNTYVKRFVAYEKHLRGKTGSSLSTRVSTWRKLREAFLEQGDLVRKVDKALGGLTILCNINNFYFICLQLYLVLRKSDGVVLNDTYYIISVGWLIFRAVSLILAAADVNLHSKQALTSLHKCPSYRYNIEIKRLKYYLDNDDVSLTGLGLFFLNRETLLEASLMKKIKSVNKR